MISRTRTSYVLRTQYGPIIRGVWRLTYIFTHIRISLRPRMPADSGRDGDNGPKILPIYSVFIKPHGLRTRIVASSTVPTSKFGMGRRWYTYFQKCRYRHCKFGGGGGVPTVCSTVCPSTSSIPFMSKKQLGCEVKPLKVLCKRRVQIFQPPCENRLRRRGSSPREKLGICLDNKVGDHSKASIRMESGPRGASVSRLIQGQCSSNPNATLRDK